MRVRRFSGASPDRTLRGLMGIADRLLHPFAAAEGRRADARARAAASERAVRAAASEREIAAHTAALAREIEVYALLVARSERVPAGDAAVPGEPARRRFRPLEARHAN